MANTIDTIGEQAVLDGLIAHTLTSFEDDRFTSLRSYAFYHNDGLESVSLPSLTEVSSYCFSQCNNLESVSLPEVTTLGNNSMYNCYNLQTINAPKLNILVNQCISQCYSLSNIDLSNVVTVNSSGLLNVALGTIILPSCTGLSGNTVSGVRTSTIDLTNNLTISATCFSGAKSLVHLILRSNTLCPLSGIGAFTNTPITNGIGWIYVPSDLVNTYKSASNWSNFASQIVPISEYPKTLQDETITDTWQQIFQAQDNNTYTTKYNLGDIKYCNIGGTYVPMQIVAFDKDVLSSNTSATAKITWISKGISFEYPFGFSGYDKDWVTCDLRPFLNNIVYPKIDSVVKNRIVAVNKTYNSYNTINNTNITNTTSDTIWIPSRREIIGGSQTESNGVDYTDFFTNATSRIKTQGMSTNAVSWGLRSKYGIYPYCINNSGGVANSSTVTSIVIGFCTN